jgi:SpoVK/Ycf46/Vps4 family AAA+-type ATPase
MATAEQLKALLRCHAEGDDARFLAIAMQVAAEEARQGHAKLAHELRELIDEAKERDPIPPRPASPTPLVQPRGELAGVLSVEYPKTRLAQMVLAAGARRRLERALREHRQAEKLRENGLAARHRILLVGPPGSGKTMTAAALAGEMGVPLFTIVLEALITKFMGETAAKLRLVFDTIRATRGVYLFDEFDALGGQRTAQNDVGEIRRVLNSFLQLLEQADSQSLIVAATNHPQMLDHALFRRFDDVIEYELPTDELASRAMRARLGSFDTSKVLWKKAIKAAKGLSYADLSRACEDAAKLAILDDSRVITTQALVRSIEERRSAHRK